MLPSVFPEMLRNSYYYHYSDYLRQSDCVEAQVIRQLENSFPIRRTLKRFALAHRFVFQLASLQSEESPQQFAPARQTDCASLSGEDIKSSSVVECDQSVPSAVGAVLLTSIDVSLGRITSCQIVFE